MSNEVWLCCISFCNFRPTHFVIHFFDEVDGYKVALKCRDGSRTPDTLFYYGIFLLHLQLVWWKIYIWCLTGGNFAPLLVLPFADSGNEGRSLICGKLFKYILFHSGDWREVSGMFKSKGTESLILKSKSNLFWFCQVKSSH